MRKLLLHIVVFFIVTALGYCVLICVWGEMVPDMFKKNLNHKIGSYGFMYSRIIEANTLSDIDVLFLGSSHAYRGFDVRLFERKGLKVFNFGSSAQTPIQTEVLLKRYLQQLKPKMVIYDIYPESFNNDGIESSLDIIANSKNDLESIKMAVKVNHIKVYNTLIYGFYRDLFNRNANFKEEALKGTDRYIENGFVEKELKYYNGKYVHDIPWTFKKEQKEAFNSIIKLLKTKNIDYYLIQVPVTKSRYKGYRNKRIFDNFIRSHGSYYNFNELIDLTDMLHFYDTQHLNNAGVKIFNQVLIETLLKK